MGTEESRLTVGDYVTLVRGTSYKGNLVGKPGPALLGLGSIEPGGGFRERHYKTYGGDCPTKLMLFPGDLYVALKGATKDGSMIGSVVRVPKTISSGRLTQDTVKLEFRNPNPHEVAYLYWLLRTPQYRAYCANRVTGSAVAALSREDFLAYPVPPLIDTRRQLVDLFELFEEQIELNQQMNHTLESIACALFKSWFIDFNPVRDKMDGRQPVGIDAETAALFPDEFEDSVLGKIPKSWKVKSIGEVVKTVGGATPSTSEPTYWEGGTIYWSTPKDLAPLSSPVLLDTERRITEKGLKKISSGLLPKGTLLLSSRAPIGYLAIAEVSLAINQGYIAMVCDQELPNHYVLRWAQINMDVIHRHANGTTFMEISKKNFRPIPILVPTQQVLTAFHKQVAEIHQKVVNNLYQNKTLISIRNALIPKLLSGEIDAVNKIHK